MINDQSILMKIKRGVSSLMQGTVQHYKPSAWFPKICNYMMMMIIYFLVSLWNESVTDSPSKHSCKKNFSCNCNNTLWKLTQFPNIQKTNFPIGLFNFLGTNGIKIGLLFFQKLTFQKWLYFYFNMHFEHGNVSDSNGFVNQPFFLESWTLFMKFNYNSSTKYLTHIETISKAHTNKKLATKPIHC